MPQQEKKEKKEKKEQQVVETRNNRTGNPCDTSHQGGPNSALAYMESRSGNYIYTTSKGYGNPEGG